MMMRHHQVTKSTTQLIPEKSSSTNGKFLNARVLDQMAQPVSRGPITLTSIL